MTLTTTVEVLPFGTLPEYLAAEEAFYQATGWDSLGLLLSVDRGEAEATTAVQAWAAHLCRWDCWLFAPVPTEEYQALEALEEEVDCRYHRLTRRHRWVPCRA